jgi:membrane-associated phospholipid phosphatase
MDKRTPGSATYQLPRRNMLWLLAFTLIAGLLCVFFVDQPLAQWFDHPEKDILRLRARDITDFALGEYWFGLAALLYITCRWILPRMQLAPAALERAKNLRTWALFYFAALCSSGLLLTAIKHIVGRERPHKTPDHDPLQFAPFNTNWHWQSMPSGHAETLFCVATSFGFLFPRYRVWFYVFAAVMSFTRVIILQHFLSDTFVGMFLGVFGAHLAWAWLARKYQAPLPLTY